MQTSPCTFLSKTTIVSLTDFKKVGHLFFIKHVSLISALVFALCCLLSCICVLLEQNFDNTSILVFNRDSVEYIPLTS